MPVKPNELSIDHFRTELINRFFHSESYFLHCFGHHLQAFLDEGGNSNKNEYLLVGNLMDKLVASQNVTSEFESILALQGFEEFKERLSNGIQYLYESDLEPEKMKIEIESLAQSMFGSAVAAFQNEESNHEIKSLLGINLIPADSVDVLELQEPSSEGPGLTESEFSMEETDGMDAIPRNQFEEKDFLLPVDEGKDANPDELEVGLVEEDGSRNSAHDDVILINSEVSQKPASVDEAFHLAVGNQVNELQNKIDLLSSENHNSNSLQKCDEIFENILSSSMICGFDAVEEVAAQARRFLANLSRQSNFDGCLAISLLTETVSVLKMTLENDPENVDEQAISNLCQNLLNPNTVVPTKEDDSVAPKQNKEKNDEPVNSGHSNLDEFKLPGEDEIFSLISEISGNSPLQQGVDMPPKSSPEPEPEISADVMQAEPEDLFSSYKQQAELYFKVIEQALNLLEGQPGHKTALKDIELACKSLVELLMKMNLDSIAETPALMSKLINSIISNRYSLSTHEHSLIKNSLKDFHDIANVVDTERREFKENLVSLQSLSSKIKMSQSPLPDARTIDKI
ncbi:hypothetical protein IH970_00195 [candidate division KSB1 bacterium]|nr:hypothetical protein [candidate division KSB1 bacterium]